MEPDDAAISTNNNGTDLDYTGNREYDFGRFSILVSDPPPWSKVP